MKFEIGDIVTLFRDTRSRMPRHSLNKTFKIISYNGGGDYKAEGITYSKFVGSTINPWTLNENDLKLIPQTPLEKEIYELESMGYRDTEDNPF